MTIRTGQWLTALAAAAILTGIASCSDNPSSGQPAATSTSPAADTDSHREERSAGRAAGSIALGDLNKPKSAKEVGAPFDPCALSWTDFPADVRPTDGQPHSPTLRAPQEGDGFDIRCLYDNSGKVAIDVNNPNASGVVGGYFLTSVIWDKENALDPSKNPGAAAKSFNNRAGLVIRSPDDTKTGAKLCLAAVRVGAGGAAGVSVTNSRFKQVDPCTVAEAVVSVIATKTQ